MNYMYDASVENSTKLAVSWRAKEIKLKAENKTLLTFMQLMVKYVCIQVKRHSQLATSRLPTGVRTLPQAFA